MRREHEHPGDRNTTPSLPTEPTGSSRDIVPHLLCPRKKLLGLSVTPPGHSPEPLTSVGTMCGPGDLGPPVLRSRKPWQKLLDGWGFWEPGMRKTVHSRPPTEAVSKTQNSPLSLPQPGLIAFSLPGPSGWCLPFSHGLALSEPDWTGTPGESSSLPHLTGWWPGLQGQPQTL